MTKAKTKLQSSQFGVMPLFLMDPNPFQDSAITGEGSPKFQKPAGSAQPP